MGEIKLPHRHGEGRDAHRLQEQLDCVGRFEAVADVFKQLDDTTRLRIFWLLCHCEECVVNLSAMMRMSSPAVSHHLRPLKTAASSSAAGWARRSTTGRRTRSAAACSTR